ncbi:hypothetical protein F0562_003118 [Nyssa sinensis]|uniref:Integrase catalytic domain-containing protein n=1 Tax=Nyssa sinensis TaxID=561372 RepID=A0A5J5BZD1_9ASTE|nr:hypothetical protein F0562_003118 [Nyssa sinensis]
MSPTKLQERRAKGLCYNCNEKFVLGHRCKKLFLIKACYEEEDGDVIIDMEEFVQEDYKEVLEISLHAISGARAPETMRPKEWSKWLAWAEYCYNTSWHSAIKMIPFEIGYGWPPPTLLSYIPSMAKVDVVEKQLMDHDQIIKDLRATLKEAQSRMKKVYDHRHREREFE